MGGGRSGKDTMLLSHLEVLFKQWGFWKLQFFILILVIFKVGMGIYRVMNYKKIRAEKVTNRIKGVSNG